MKLLPLVTLFLLSGTQAQSSCNYVTLVKCFIDILDEWTWTLYELKDNVVTINSSQCQHLKQLDQCILADEEHHCNHEEIVEASNTVSDLLTHRRNSGSFLKSYYLLTYACSPEGQELLSKHNDCLSREKLGEMTLSAGSYLSENYIQHRNAETGAESVCNAVNDKLNEYMRSLVGVCDGHAAKIMCKSLVNMFKGLHADKLHDCEFTCLQASSSEEEENVSSEADQYSMDEHSSEPLNGVTSTTSSLFLTATLPFVVRFLTM